jgi:hypothetical protein
MMDPHSLQHPAICRRGEGGGPAVVEAGGDGGGAPSRECRGHACGCLVFAGVSQLKSGLKISHERAKVEQGAER